MTDESVDSRSPGRLRALLDRLLGGTPTLSSSSSQGPETELERQGHPSRIGHYAIVRRLGEGGMGIVYEARDPRLERTVALKTMSSLAGDQRARQRFWREARAAASVSHPNVCQIYDVGDDRGALFITMELLEGETLAARLRRGPLSVPEAMPIALGMLAALTALHARGIVHRDLKPSNVFLTPFGVKLLDFGLARPQPDDSTGPMTALTRSGMVLGTPQYMAPEQVLGDPVTAQSDLFAFGSILFEMLAGRSAFSGPSVIAVLHATVTDQPPALTGSPAVIAMDRVIRRALAKRPADRPPSAEAMTDELAAIPVTGGGETPVLARALTRIVILPFRPLRPDPDTDFLAFSLPDAIATSLASIGSLIVRSTAAAARFAGEAPDLKAVATDAGVDRVVMGTLLRSGEQLRVTAQLVDAPDGTLLTTHTVQSSMGDLFSLQDDIARSVVAALSLPLGGGVSSPAPDAPENPQAYELYLRANELARTYDGLARARELYRQCLELDPRFAPAWAQLGRCHRVLGKYVDGAPASEIRAKEALERALELNPRLSVAHKYFAQLEADIGQVDQALVRLLGEAARHGNDPELFAGLVHVCRYCGLFDESIAAHAEARRLDPKIATSLEQTLLMTGDIDRLLAVERPSIIAGADDGIRVMGLGLAGRRDEAREALLDMRRQPRIPTFQTWTDYLLAWLERRAADMLVGLSDVGMLKIQDDPEAMFLEGWLLCDAGEHASGLGYLQRAVAKGYAAARTLAASRHFDALRSSAEFQSLLADAEAGRARALEAFRSAGGDRLLGRG